MKVYVVVSDVGLNGTWVHGVYSQRPNESDVQDFVMKFTDWPNGYRGTVAGQTGYSGTEIVECEVDAPLS